MQIMIWKSSRVGALALGINLYFSQKELARASKIGYLKELNHQLVILMHVLLESFRLSVIALSDSLLVQCYQGKQIDQ